MRPLRALVIVSLLVLVTPSVLANDAFTSTSLRIDGAATLDGPASALFLVATNRGASWDLTADKVIVERSYEEFVGTSTPQYSHMTPPQTERSTYGASVLASTAFRPEGAILAQVASGMLKLDAATSGTMAMNAVKDPQVDEGPRPQATVGLTGNSQAPDYRIHERILGSFVNITSTAGDYRLAGDITLLIFESDYTLESGGKTTEMRTGRVVTSETGVIVQGRVERQTLHLTNAVLHARAPSSATVFSEHPVVSFTGALAAVGNHGALSIPTLSLGTDGRWTGTATIALAPSGDFVTVAPTTTLAASSVNTRAAVAPPALQLALILLALAGLVVTALVLLRRRELGVDHLQVALLAMEERRWTDALPHLDRILAKRPADASILMDRALCLEEVGRLDAARAGYEAALAAEPHNAELHYYYARVLARLRMSTASMAHLTRALALDSRLAELARGESAFGAFADHPSFVGLVR